MFALDLHHVGRFYEFLGGIGPTMLSGFNTNFRYRGVLFHVQTEDSGRGNPHVITHLFHGGNIIASEKQDYSELLAEDDLEGAVKKMMEGQHKAILKQLSRGGHDAAINERLGADIFLAERTSATDSTGPPTVTEEDRPSVVGEAAGPRRAQNIARSPAPLNSSPSSSRSPVITDPSSDIPAPRTAAQTTTALSRVFGERVVSEKPLDEVVLDYLVENARKRRRQPK